MNTLPHVFWLTYIHISLTCKPGNRIAESQNMHCRCCQNSSKELVSIRHTPVDHENFSYSTSLSNTYNIVYLFHISHSNEYVVFSSVAQSCLTLCDPMNHSTPGLPVHHQLPEFTQTHVHRVSDAIQPSHPLSFPSPPAPNPSQHQSLLFQ